jgi:glycosyltransferase involved in cell wall biosynthesis
MEASMRVAIISDYPLDTTRIQGGVQAAAVYLVKGLARINDLDVHVLRLKPSGWTGPNLIEQSGITLHLLPIYPRFERARNYRNYQSSLNSKLAEIQPDILHAQDATSNAYVALRSSYPTIVTAQGIRREDGKYYSSVGRRLRNYFDSYVIERYIMCNVRYLIATGRYVTDFFAGILRSDIKVYYLSNPIDERFFDLNGVQTPQNVVLLPGRVIPRKRVIDLVQAFKGVVEKIPSAQLRIAGECSSEPTYVESVHRLIRQTNLEENVHILGPLPEAEILNEFTRCSIIALPSAQETSPLVLGQAAAAGKPVIATRVGGVAEMTGEKEERGILVNVGDIEGLASAMLRLLLNNALYSQISQSAYGFALENYHVDCVAHQTYEIYKQVLLEK